MGKMLDAARCRCWVAACACVVALSAGLTYASDPISECDDQSERSKVVTMDTALGGTLPVDGATPAPCLRFALPEDELRAGHIVVHIDLRCPGHGSGLTTQVQLRQGDAPMTEEDVDITVKGTRVSVPLHFENAGEPFFIAFAAQNVTKAVKQAGIGYSVAVNTIYDCFDDCSGRGQCNNGTCACTEGFTGDDCALRVSEFSVPKLPTRPMLLVIYHP